MEEAAEEARESSQKAEIQKEDMQRAADESANKVAISKERNTKMEEARVVPRPWLCKLCIKTKEDCGKHCKDKTWEDVSKEISELQEDNQG